MTYDKHECDLMCERLAAYLEGDLAPEDRTAADAHLASCAACRAVLAELRTIAAQAAALPPLNPSRDLWAGIESRIGTRVTPLGAPLARRATRRPWPLAIAAAALIALTAGTTYLLTTRQGATRWGIARDVVSVESRRCTGGGVTTATVPMGVAPCRVVRR